MSVTVVPYREVVSEMPRLRGITENLIRIRLFFVSYAPLWVMLAFRAAPPGRWYWDGRGAAVIVFGILAGWGFLDAIRLVHGATETNSLRLTFGGISGQGGNAAGYLATYILPFVGLVPAAWGDWAAYGVYFVVAGIVFIRTDLTFVNPTLYILGYRVVSANAYVPEDRSLVPGSPFVVICRDPKVLTSTVEVASIGGGYVTKKPKKSGGTGKPEGLPGSRGDLSAAGREGRMEGD
jgi:hypothetical protein